jgi:urease accessory protein
VITRRPHRCLGAFPLLAGLIFLPIAAQAHSSIDASSDVINGLLHPLTTPTHLLIIVALGLMAGRQTKRELKAPFLIFAPLSALAFALTTAGWVSAVYPAILIATALCPAVLLALEKHPPVAITCALFAVAAVALGLDSAVEGGTPKKTIKILFGNWICLNVLIFDLAIYVSMGAQARWLRIALRVAGSWIIAIGLMVLAFTFRK